MAATEIHAAVLTGYLLNATVLEPWQILNSTGKGLNRPRGETKEGGTDMTIRIGQKASTKIRFAIYNRDGSSRTLPSVTSSSLRLYRTTPTKTTLTTLTGSIPDSTSNVVEFSLTPATSDFSGYGYAEMEIIQAGETLRFSRWDLYVQPTEL